MRDRAKLFKSGGSQAVRLPKDYRFEDQDDLPGASFTITQPIPVPGEGDYYIIRAQSACATATYGFATSVGERLPTAACP